LKPAASRLSGRSLPAEGLFRDEPHDATPLEADPVVFLSLADLTLTYHLLMTPRVWFTRQIRLPTAILLRPRLARLACFKAAVVILVVSLAAPSPASSPGWPGEFWGWAVTGPGPWSWAGASSSARPPSVHPRMRMSKEKDLLGGQPGIGGGAPPAGVYQALCNGVGRVAGGWAHHPGGGIRASGPSEQAKNPRWCGGSLLLPRPSSPECLAASVSVHAISLVGEDSQAAGAWPVAGERFTGNLRQRSTGFRCARPPLSIDDEESFHSE